jgi:hypothetical protein
MIGKRLRVLPSKVGATGNDGLSQIVEMESW